MNIEHLKYIIEVAKLGTISKAAEKNHISHSAISQAISGLESEIGVLIFNRSRSGSICTEDGESVIKLAKEIINKTKELKELGDKSSLVKGNLRISAASIFFTTLLPEVLYAFKQTFPNVQLIINEDDVANIEESVKNNEVDIGLSYDLTKKQKSEDSRLTYHSLFQTKFLICVGKDSLLAYNKKITPEEVIRHPLALRNENAGIKFWENTLSNYGEVNVLLYSNNNDVIKNVIANNLAIGIYTDFWIRQDPLIIKGDIIPIPLEIENVPILNLTYMQAKNKYASIVENEFLKFLLQRFDEYKSKLN